MPKESGFINGGLMLKIDMVSGPVIVMQVDDIKAALEKIEANGGKKLMDPHPVGEMGHYAYIEDTENNVVGLWQDA